MPILDMKDLLHHARDHRYAVAAFQVTTLAEALAALAAAEECRAPLILEVDGRKQDGRMLAPLLAGVETAARHAAVPVALHCGPAVTLDEAAQGIRLGCNGVASDSACAVEVVRMAHACGIAVEGGLPAMPLSTEEALRFVSESGVDFLAVAAGGGDVGALGGLRDALSIPLTCRAGDGLDEVRVQGLAAAGISKISLGRPAGDAEALARLFRHCGSNDRAADLLARCPPWEPVEHLILFNLAAGGEAEADALMARGREVLAGIPGVRAVVTGKAIQPGARYQLSWLIRFAHPAVVDSYRDHPDHVAFADRYFRPVAGDRISIDYRLVTGPLPPSAPGR